jgi:hypothetical protein
VKILGNGEMATKLTVVAGWYSKSAIAKITAAGGTAQNAKGEAFEFPKPKKKFVLKAKSESAKPEGGKKKGDQPAEQPAEAKKEEVKKEEAKKDEAQS